MFEFIKKLFKEEETTEPISLDSIDSWFDKKTNVVFYKINNEVSTFNIRLKGALIKLREELVNLENAKLKNPNIPQKMIDIMSGNRESFIKKHKHFVDSINIPKDYTDVDYFIDEVEKYLNNLHDSTQKSYYVLHEFFEHEAYEVTSNVKKIDSLIKELKDKLSEYNLRKINKLKEDISNLKSKIEFERISKEKIEKAEDYLNELNTAKDNIDKDIDDLKKSDEFNYFNRLKEEKETLLKKEEENNNKVHHFFSNIEHALKKYSRICQDENLVKAYLENPIKALNSDPNLKIIEILRKMKESIEKIELKADKKERIISNIDKIDVDFFIKFIDKHNELKENIKVKDREIKECDAVRKIKELNDKLEKSKENIRRLSENIDYLHKEHDKINVIALKDELQVNLSSTFGSNVVIK